MDAAEELGGEVHLLENWLLRQRQDSEQGWTILLVADCDFAGSPEFFRKFAEENIEYRRLRNCVEFATSFHQCKDLSDALERWTRLQEHLFRIKPCDIELVATAIEKWKS